MPDLSRVISGFDNIGGFAWGASTQKLYFSSNGVLHFLDPVTGSIGGVTLPGASSVGDLAISPGGAFVLVADRTARPPLNGVGADGIGTYYRVSLADGQVDTLRFTIGYGVETGSSDIVALSDGRALLTTEFIGSGVTGLRIFHAAAPSPTAQNLPNFAVGTPALLESSESHRYVVIGENRSSAGVFDLFDTATGTIVARGQINQFPGHTFGDFVQNVDISEAAGLIVIGGRDGAMIVTDLSTRLVKDLSFDFKLRPAGVLFSPDGGQLLISQSDNDQIAVIDTHTWTQIGSYQLQAPLAAESRSHTGSLAFSTDGRLLFVDTNSGIEIIDVTAHPITPGAGDVSTPRVDVPEPFALAAGQTVDHEGIGYRLMATGTGTTPILSIAGTLNVSGSGATGVHGVLGYPAQLFVVERSGTLRVTGTDANGSAIGYVVDGFYAPGFTNLGQVIVSSQGVAKGVESYALQGAYVNQGVFQVTGQAATGFRLVNLGTPSFFYNSGLIEVRDAGGANGSSTGVVMLNIHSTFENVAGGSIVVTHAAPGQIPNVGVRISTFSQDPAGDDLYSNGGLIQSDIALRMEQRTDEPARQFHERFFHNEATGILRGTVQLNGNGAGLDNAGFVDGAVVMGDYSERYDGSRGGRVTGMVSGGGGDDQLIGGPGFDNFQGNTGNDLEQGRGGDDWVVGGKGDDTLTGDEGADIVYGNIGADTCAGGEGNDTVRGGQDNDVLSGGAGDDFVSGDRGDDTVAGGLGADLFHTFGDAGVDRVVDFNLAEGDRVMLDAGTQYTVAQVGPDTVVSMTGGAQLILISVQMNSLTPGWIFAA